MLDIWKANIVTPSPLRYYHAMSDKKATKCAEIVRLQDRLASMKPTNPQGGNDPEYTAAVDEYLSFLLYFVGSVGYEWNEARLTRLERLMEVRTPIRTVEALMKIPEDMIPPVAVREMMIGDEEGPWMHAIFSVRIQEFMERYPFLLAQPKNDLTP